MARTIPLSFAMAGGVAFDCSSEIESEDDSNPHFNKNNCHGQYFPARNDQLTKLAKQAGEAGLPLGTTGLGDYFLAANAASHYKPVGESERRALVEASPPPVLEVKRTDLLVGPDPATTPTPVMGGKERVYYRKVAGADYLVTQTAMNGYAIHSMNGQHLTQQQPYGDGGFQTTVTPAPKVEAVCVGGQWVRF